VSEESELRQRILAKLLRSDRAQELARQYLRKKPADESLECHDGLDYAAGEDEQVEQPITFEAYDYPELEAMVRLSERPAILVRDNTIDFNGVEDYWKGRLQARVAQVHGGILAAARVEARNVPKYDWIGSAFLADKNRVVTNRHVAEMFAEGRGTSVKFRAYSHLAGAGLNFKRELDRDDQQETIFEATRVLYLAAPLEPDMAVLEINWRDQPPRTPLELRAQDLVPGQAVMVIGHPGENFKTRRKADMRRIFAGGFDVKRLAPGEIMDVSTRGGTEFTHDCSTLGGTSGSAVLDLETGRIVGLHFSGTEEFENCAVHAKVVQEVLASLA
jgi:endonuclease G